MFVSSFPISGFWPFSLSKNSNLENQSKWFSKIRNLAIQSISRPRPKWKIDPTRVQKKSDSLSSFNKIKLVHLVKDSLVIGSQATVQFGTLPSGKKVALKIYKQRKVFTREFNLFRRVYGVPHLVEVKGFTSVGREYAMVMEEAEGGDLFGVLKCLESKKRTLPLSTVSLFARQLLEALGNLHKKGIVHGDVKPENILYKPDTREVVITDLGSATVYTEKDSKQESGTGVYASPEFLLKLPPDPVQDIRSLGLTLYTVYTGRLLLQPSESHHCLLRNLQEEFGAIPEWMIEKMDPETKESFFTLEKGQYIFKGGKIESKTTWKEIIRETGRKNEESKESVEAFIDLLSKMLSYGKRPTAKKLLTHPSMQKDVSFKVYIEGEESVSLKMTSKAQDKEGSPLAERHFKLLPKRFTCLHVPSVPGGQYTLEILGAHQVKQEISISQGKSLKISL